MRGRQALGEHTHGLGGAGNHVVAVKLGNVIHGNALRAGGLALVQVGAVAEKKVPVWHSMASNDPYPSPFLLHLTEIYLCLGLLGLPGTRGRNLPALISSPM